MRHAHDTCRVVLVAHARVREADCGVSPDTSSTTDVEQCSDANRVCSRDGPLLTINRVRRAVRECLVIQLGAEVHVEKEAADLTSRHRLRVNDGSRACDEDYPQGQ